MRTKSCENRKYNSKGKATKSNSQKYDKINNENKHETHFTKCSI